jgi:hypothetical protein
LLDAISHVACLGFEKSYRESIVLMTRSYLDKVKAVGASENNTLPSEATTERTEVCDELLRILSIWQKCNFNLFFFIFYTNYVSNILDSSCRLSACFLQPHKHKTQVWLSSQAIVSVLRCGVSCWKVRRSAVSFY